MKCVKKMGRSLSIASLLVACCAIDGLFHQQIALAQSQYLTASNPEDLPCYMQTSDGRVLNLSKLCGNKNPAVSTISTIDQQFLQRYQSFLEKRAKGVPAVQVLIAQAQKNPQAIIQRAQAICAAMRAGQPQPQLGQQMGDDLFQTMAPKYYCPELDD